MKNLINKIKDTKETITTSWTYNHKHLIITLSLAVAIVVQSGLLTPYIPSINFAEAEVISYTKPAPVPDPIDVMVQKRAEELYKANEKYDLEKYRHEAIRELNVELLGTLDDSPYVDYQALKAEYGY